MSPTTSKRSVTDREEFLSAVDHALHHGNAPLALAVTDLDDFASVNDRHGYDAGDQVLVAWERVLDSNLPADADVIRLGGDEYAVVLPGQSAENALILLDEIRSHFAAND